MRLVAAGSSLRLFLSSLIGMRCKRRIKPFHDAPASAKAQKNPYEGQQAAVDAGKQLYARNCLACHGKTCKVRATCRRWWMATLKGVTPGEVFWFVTKGDKDNGMPSWAFLPEDKRWQIVTYVEAMASGKTAAAGPTSAPAPEVRGVKVKGAPPNAAVHGFPLREAGNHPQDYGERSAAAVCDRFVGERCGGGGASGERVAGGAAGIQGGTVCVRTGQSALDADALRTAIFFWRRWSRDAFAFSAA